jgi:MFS family permease
MTGYRIYSLVLQHYETSPVIRLLQLFIRDIRTGTRQLWSDGKGWILVTVSVGWFLSIGVRIAYPALVPFFRSDLGISLTTAGFLLTVLWVAYAAGQFPGGLLGDRYGKGNILVFSTALSAVALSLVALAPTVETLFIGTIAFGFATALFGPTRFTIFSDVFPAKTGTAVGITMAGGNIGNTVLPICAVLVAEHLDWRLFFAAIVFLFVGATTAFWMTLPGRTTTKHADLGGEATPSIRRFFRRIFQRGVPIILTIQILMSLIYQGFIGFYPTYFIEIKGFTPRLSAFIFGLFFFSATIVQVISGTLQDNVGTRRTLMTVIGVFFVGLVALPYVQGILPILPVTVMISARAGTGVINNTFIANSLPADIQSAGLGLLRTSWILIGAASPVVVGTLGDRGMLGACHRIRPTLLSA